MNAGLWLAWGHYFFRRLGWPGLLGLALALAAAATHLVGVVPIQEHNDQLRMEADRLRQLAAVQPETLPPAEIRTLAALPSGDELMPLVAAVHAGARRRQVVLDQGEYLWQGDAGTRTGRYRMTFPARGSYPQLRGWAADVLAEWPALALDEFDFRRDNIGSESVQAQVRFTVRVGEDRQ